MANVALSHTLQSELDKLHMRTMDGFISRRDVCVRSITRRSCLNANFSDVLEIILCQFESS